LIPASFPFTRAITASALCSFAERSSHGFMFTNTSAVFVCAEPVRMSRPFMATMFRISGCARRMPSTCSTTAPVRLSEAASGSCIVTAK
jgi:hypothetical protein